MKKRIKTDSLGLEILNSISMDEDNKKIKIFNNENEIENKENNSILFEIHNQNKIEGFFTLNEQTYLKWVKEYKLEGVEI